MAARAGGRQLRRLAVEDGWMGCGREKGGGVDAGAWPRADISAESTERTTDNGPVGLRARTQRAATVLLFTRSDFADRFSRDAGRGCCCVVIVTRTVINQLQYHGGAASCCSSLDT